MNDDDPKIGTFAEGSSSYTVTLDPTQDIGWNNTYTYTTDTEKVFDFSTYSNNITTTTLDDVVFPSDESRNINIMEMNDRLARIEKHIGIIGNPDPDMLKKYEMLKNAYEEYKMIEKLCLGGELYTDGEN